MDPITIGLLLGGAFLFLKGKAAPVAPVPVAPSVMTSQPSSIIQYTSNAPPPRVIENTSASPIEQSGYIPPYLATPGPSAVALGGMDACGCGDCGMGDLSADRNALSARLMAIRRSYWPQIQAATRANNVAALTALTTQLHTLVRAALAQYHNAHPNERPEIVRTSPSAAPVFMRRPHRMRA
jgi:hypothetical protein